MKPIVSALVRVAISVLLVTSPCNAEPHQPIATRIVNLGSQNIIAFSIVDVPFRDVGLEAQPGDPLTPDFGIEGKMDYQIYWRLQDGSVHGAHVDLRLELPSTFYGDVAIGIHDNRLSVSWFNMNPAWIEYGRVGDPSKIPPTTELRYSTCGGEMLSNPIALKSWRDHANAVRQRLDDGTGGDEQRIAEGKCLLAWYIRPADGRQRKKLDEETAKKLRSKWIQDIEDYKAGSTSARRQFWRR